MGIIDTHAHVACNELFERIDEIINNAKEAGLLKILIVCTNLEEGKRAIKLCEENDLFDCAIGFHPEDAGKISELDLSKLENMLKNKYVVALGEIGLDYYWVSDNKDEQKSLFINQIKLANKFDLPVLIHMRDASEDTLKILKENPCKGVLHCYSGSAEIAKEILKLGMYISFAGPITFKNAKNAPDVCKIVPIERLFVETDCPYLTPHPHRGKQNEPSFVKYTFSKVCEIKKISENELMIQMINNYLQLFNKTKLIYDEFIIKSNHLI